MFLKYIIKHKNWSILFFAILLHSSFCTAHFYHFTRERKLLASSKYRISSLPFLHQWMLETMDDIELFFAENSATENIITNNSLNHHSKNFQSMNIIYVFKNYVHTHDTSSYPWYKYIPMIQVHTHDTSSYPWYKHMPMIQAHTYDTV